MGLHHGTTFPLTDRDICTDLLYSEKQLALSYVIAESECADAPLRHSLHQLHHEEGELHQRIFQYMQQRGWYETPGADFSLKQQVANLWNQKLSSLRSSVSAGHGSPYAFGTSGYGGASRGMGSSGSTGPLQQTGAGSYGFSGSPGTGGLPTGVGALAGSGSSGVGASVPSSPPSTPGFGLA